MRRLLVILIIFSCVSLVSADWWTTTDWSDSTTYDSIVNLNGFRQPNNLILNAPDVYTWTKVWDFTNATKVYDLLGGYKNQIFAATGNSEGNVFATTDEGSSWYNTEELGSATIVHDLVAEVVQGDSTIFAAVLQNQKGYIYRSTNPDTFWIRSSTPMNAGNTCITKSSSYLIAGTGQNVPRIYTSNDGDIWTQKLNLFGKDYLVTFFYTVTPETILATTGYTKGHIYASFNAGDDWESVDTIGKGVNCIVEDYNTNLYCGTVSNNIFRSTDGGMGWELYSSISDFININTLLFLSEGEILAGGSKLGDIGAVALSSDTGLTWELINSFNETNGILSSLQTDSKFLLCGSYGDGSVFRAAYFQAGYLISRPFYTGTTNGSTKYGFIQWSDSLNGQIVEVWVRTAKDDSMNSAPYWGAGFPPVSNGDSINHNSAVNEGDSYVQYRVKLKTQDPGVTPFLKEISIEYSVDTLGPYPESAIAYDGVIQQNGIDDDDYVIITFNEATNKCSIPKDTIDFILKLSDTTHTWGNIDTTFWSDEGVGNATFLTIRLDTSAHLEVDVTIITPETVIKDVWGNNARGHIKLTGTFDDEIPPVIISAFASDSIDSIQGIDNDDFIRLIFDQETISNSITADNIDSVLRLSGGHTWGTIDTSIWDSSGETLTIHLDTTGNPTVEVGDTISPDSLTIKDVNENPCFSPVVITGTFGDYGPVIDSAVAYDNIIDSIGIDSDDYVFLFFNKGVDTGSSQIDSANIDSVLKLNINDKHTWIPIDTASAKWIGDNDILLIRFNPGDSIPTIEPGDTIYPDSVTIIDLLGQPCINPVVLTGSFDPGVEESKTPIVPLPVQLNLSIHPNPAGNVITILYEIPFEHSISKKSRTKIEIFDITGRKVQTILDKDILPGRYSIIWQAKHVKQGIYFIKISSDNKTLTRKLIYLR